MSKGSKAVGDAMRAGYIERLARAGWELTACDDRVVLWKRGEWAGCVEHAEHSNSPWWQQASCEPSGYIFHATLASAIAAVTGIR